MSRSSGRPVALALVVGLTLACGDDATEEATPVMTVQELLALPTPAADHRIPYGDHPLQFGDLRVPPGEGPFPVAVLVHGGCWLAPYDLSHLSSLAAALAAEGIATWSLEYRRVGDDGGGWPGTFLDVAQGTDYLRELASLYPLNLSRVALVGHSAGGHLVLWLVGRPNLPSGSPGSAGDSLRPSGVVALAGIPDLARSAELAVCGDAISRLLGGDPGALPERVACASPSALLPLSVPVTLVVGERDDVVPGELAEAFALRARSAGDQVVVRRVTGVGHYELVTPGSSAWPTVLKAVRRIVGS